MDYGIMINSSMGNTQIDSTFRNVILKRVYTNVDMWPEYVLNFNPPIVTIPPLTAMRPSTNYFSSLAGLKKESNNYVGLTIYREYIDVSGTIEIMECNTIPNTPLHGKYGIEVYNADGDICFNSEEHYLRVFSKVHINLPNLNTMYFWANSSHVDMSVGVEHTWIQNPFYILSPCWSTSATVRRKIIDNIGVHYNRCLSLGLRKISPTVVVVGFYVWSVPPWTNYWINPTHVPSSCDLLICGI